MHQITAAYAYFYSLQYFSSCTRLPGTCMYACGHSSWRCGLVGGFVTLHYSVIIVLLRPESPRISLLLIPSVFRLVICIQRIS
jgi:hypothetical protein